MKVMVTGATGFVGSHLADQLLKHGHEVTLLVRTPERAAHLAERGARLVRGDLADVTAIAEASEGQDVVHHVAALTGAVNEAEFLATNREGTRRILEAAEAAKVGRLVLLSSGAAGGPASRGRPRDASEPDQPVTMYGRSKLAAEQLVRAADLPWTILRPPAVYGPRDTENFLAVFRAANRLGITPVFGDGSQELSMIHVSDLADACCRAATAEAVIGGTYYVNHPEVVTARAIVETIGRHVGRTPTVVPLPEWITRSLLAITGTTAALLRRKTILRADKANEFYQPAWTGDPTAFMRDTDWHPAFDLVTGMADTAAWYRQEGLL
jgi:nucleoside-diphosphate-sugar epimerase